MSGNPKLKVTSGYHPATVPIDGYAIDLLITRMTLDDFAAFIAGLRHVFDAHSDRLVSMRLPGEEQERRPAALTDEQQLVEFSEAVDLYKDDRLHSLLGAYKASIVERSDFVIPDTEIRRRRLVEMTAPQRGEYERLHDEEEDVRRTFLGNSISRYVRVVPGQIEVTDHATGQTHDATEGSELVTLWGARRDVLMATLRAIRDKNMFRPALKNDSPSPSDSLPSSNGPEGPEASGVRPAPPATSADGAPSVTSGAAMASSVSTTCG